ncbi:MAG TPA: ribonuclease HI family protein [Fimbriiglobus sp.]|jgi:ribonuclease HI
MPEATVHIDGAARGNPGPAACAFVLDRPGEPVVERAERLGTATNNVAEYTALLAALDAAAELGVKSLRVFSDSELLVKQMNGEYRVKNPDLQSLYAEAQTLVRRFDAVTLTHVRREQNKRADELCNEVLDAGKKAASPPAPAGPPGVVTDAAVRADVLACLTAAARSWAEKGPTNPPPGQVWDQIWSILEDGGVLKKVKKK